MLGISGGACGLVDALDVIRASAGTFQYFIGPFHRVFQLSNDRLRGLAIDLDLVAFTVALRLWLVSSFSRAVVKETCELICEMYLMTFWLGPCIGRCLLVCLQVPCQLEI